MASSTESSAKECGICSHEYDEEDRCPRTLPCFHTLCSSCILDIIRTNNKKCPFCRQGFQGHSLSNFRVNNNALEMLKYIKDLESKILSSKGSVALPSIGVKELKRQMAELNSKNIASSLATEILIENEIKKNDELGRSLVNANNYIQKEIIMKAEDIASTNNRQVLRLELNNKKLAEQLKVLKEKRRQMEEAQKKMDSARTYTEAGSVMDEGEKINSELHAAIEHFQITAKNSEKLHQGIFKNVKAIEERVSVIQEMLNCFEKELKTVDDDIDLYLGLNSLSIQEDLTVESLKQMNDHTKGLVEQGRICVVKLSHGKLKYARLSISENKYLCLHHIRKEPIPHDVYLLEFDEVMRMVDPVSRLCFLELKHKTTDKTLGKLIIHLTHNTRRAKNFQLLCTGQMGPSYSDTKIINACDKGTKEESLWFGDYECGNGTGGKSLVPLAGYEKGGALNQNARAGAVMPACYDNDDSLASQVLIYTNDRSKSTYDCIFGYVTDGLHILKDAINRYPRIWKTVNIGGCGVVLKTL